MLLLASLVAAGGLSAAASSEPPASPLEFSSRVAPTVVRYPTTLTYELTMVNKGDRTESFAVELIQPYYQPPRGVDGGREGPAVEPLDLGWIRGPGEIVKGEDYQGTFLRCSSAGVGDHGYGHISVHLDVSLPPRSTSVLVNPYRAGLPPWPDLDYALGYRLSPRLSDGGRGTIGGVRLLRSPSPRVAGRRAVHLTFQTSPRSPPGGTAEPEARVRLGTPVRVLGRARPAIPGQRVSVRFARIGDQGRILERREVASVRVRRSGRFSASWMPDRPGRYEIWAAYRSQRKHLVSDDTCPRTLAVVARP